MSPTPTDWTAENDEWADLVGAAKAGDRLAFEELVRATYVDTYTLALRLTANEEDARDVVQEVYLRAWKGIGRFRGDAQVAGDHDHQARDSKLEGTLDDDARARDGSAEQHLDPSLRVLGGPARDLDDGIAGQDQQRDSEPDDPHQALI